MADPDDKVPENVPGKYYVDSSCIICSLCPELAPENFAEAPDGTHDYVYKQPENEEEEAACQDAMAQCPVNSIGDDGDE